ncbi:DUF3048 domain-containing protein [Filobacillus milosensis]|uniref:DUF3048 domain-containing protein n=1 Tax=Filobacillus milosensis TaxID=94137 RepID=A0A4Y8IKU3_9BACI|nr:DUF3048 domain-containing protein [Filobacillus milosensis]TFB14199.1 DUF3048 domain-containing protein [Filobacillus milosensis]
MKKVYIFLLVAIMLVLVGCGDDSQQTDEKNEPVEEAVASESTEDEETEKEEEPEPEEEPEKEEEPVYNGPVSVTTGLPIDDENAASKRFSIMIENSPKARPHTGLVNADVVYEMHVEGLVTRFLAIYSDDIPEKIGPARSSRHYYLPVAESWDIPYIHYGGSPQAYAKFPTLSVPRIDGIYSGKHFKRDTSRRAPHNAYFYTEPLDPIENQPVNNKFEFDKEATYDQTQPATTLDIRYNNFTHVAYEYDSEANVYKRSLEGNPHADRVTGEQIKASNIIVMYAKHNVIPGDTAGRINITLSGQGDAQFFFNGEVVEGMWKNESGNIRYYVNGEVIKLQPGKTWVQVVNTTKRDTVSY